MHLGKINFVKRLDGNSVFSGLNVLTYTIVSHILKICNGNCNVRTFEWVEIYFFLNIQHSVPYE